MCSGLENIIYIVISKVEIWNVDTFQLLACSFSTRRHRTLFLFFSGNIRRQKSGTWLKATSILFFFRTSLYLTAFRANVFPQLQFNNCLCWWQVESFLPSSPILFVTYCPRVTLLHLRYGFVRVCSPRCFLCVKTCALFAGKTSGVILLRLMFLF
jgi:hypothetical protein